MEKDVKETINKETQTSMEKGMDIQPKPIEYVSFDVFKDLKTKYENLEYEFREYVSNNKKEPEPKVMEKVETNPLDYLDKWEF